MKLYSSHKNTKTHVQVERFTQNIYSTLAESGYSYTYIRQNRHQIEKVTDKNGEYIIIKRTIYQKDIVINICAPNIGVPKYMKQLLTDLKEEIDSNTIIVGDFNTPLTLMDRSSRQKVNKETVTLNVRVYHMNLIDL